MKTMLKQDASDLSRAATSSVVKTIFKIVSPSKTTSKIAPSTMTLVCHITVALKRNTSKSSPKPKMTLTELDPYAKKNGKHSEDA